jgi:hypothetical protein
VAVEAGVLIGAGTALAGTGVGAAVSLAVEGVRSKAAARASRRDALLVACSSFTAAVARTRSQCHRLSERPEEQVRVRGSLEDSRVECERLRLLVDDKQTQRAARLALRHLYAVWHLAERGSDPRADQYPDESPDTRLRRELTALYVGVRRETGSPSPDEVFEELED